jgi:hypothetical protein
MISATIVNANTSTAEASAGQPGSSAQAGAAESAADFLTQLQAAMSMPSALPEEVLAVPSQEPEAPAAEMTELVGLQNLPTAGVPIVGAAANFAVLLDAPIQTVTDDPLLVAQPNAVGGVVEGVSGTPEFLASDPLAVMAAAKVSAAPESSDAAPLVELAQQSADPSMSIDQAALSNERVPVAQPTLLPEPTVDAVQRLPEPVVAAANEVRAVVGQALAPEQTAQAQLAQQFAVSVGNKPALTDANTQQVPADPVTIDLEPQELTPVPVVDAVTADDGAPADKLILANAPDATAVNAGNLQDAPDASMANVGATPAQQPSSALTATSPILEASHRMPLEPHQMRLDGGPVQVEVLKLVRQGGGQIVMELTPPDQGTYRLDLRLDSQGRAQLFVEGASDSVRTRLEQSEAVLREQLSQMGLDLQLNYRQESRSFADANDASESNEVEQVANGRQDGGNFASEQRTRSTVERGLVHLYA